MYATFVNKIIFGDNCLASCDV